jgi:hypothetical protein
MRRSNCVVVVLAAVALTSYVSISVCPVQCCSPDPDAVLVTSFDKHAEWFLEVKERINLSSAKSKLEKRVRCGFQMLPDGRITGLTTKLPHSTMGTLDKRDSDEAIEIIREAMTRPLKARIPNDVSDVTIWAEVGGDASTCNVWTKP